MIITFLATDLARDHEAMVVGVFKMVLDRRNDQGPTVLGVHLVTL